jgi:asparagine synthase (glutamine-hydrolysing)
MPGCHLHYRGGETAIHRYWEPVYVERNDTPLGELEHEFRAILREGVRRSAAKGGVGCFLSGGTDSSTIAGLLSEIDDTPARTYSIGFKVEGYDELRYARTAAQHFHTDHHEYIMTPNDVVELLPRVAAAYSDPFGNESALAAFHCARMARESGLKRMLGGDGGDELFGGNKRYARQKMFEVYAESPRIAKWILEGLCRSVPGGESIPPVRKARSFVRQSAIPMPRRARAYNYLAHFGPDQVFDPDFLSTVDPDVPDGLVEETYHSAKAGTMVNRYLATDLRFTLADNDLPKVSRMCEMAGVAADYPLLSDELVEFSLRVPARLKVKGLRLRWFWKHALREFLPSEVLRKPKHGMGIPIGLWMRDHTGLREATLDRLNDLKRRGIIRDGFLEKLVNLHHSDHAHYYGGMIWVLVQLEEWFKQQSPSGSNSPEIPYGLGARREA